jgi:ACR3 family arsenite efflux pump ArsB
MENNEFTIKKIAKSLQMLFYVLLAGQFIFAIFAYIYSKKQGKLAPDSGDVENIVTTALYIMTLINIPLGYYLHTKKLKSILLLKNLEEKLMRYRESFLIKLMLFESITMFSLVVFLLYSNYQSFIVVAIVLVLFFMNKPTEFMIQNELELEYEEKADNEIKDTNND